MIATQVLGNVHSPGGAALVRGRHVERVTLPSEKLVQRIQRLTTDHGRELGLRLPAESPDLADGDVLVADDTGAVVVEVLGTDVLVIRATSLRQMAFAAHSLGNRHLQAQFFGSDDEAGYGGDVMVVRYDHTVADFLTHHGVPFTREERVMPVPFRHSEHTH